MTEKTLNTRIINKHADLATWSTSTLVLKAGEIALASINITKPDGQGGSITVPTYLMKVGDGSKTFKDLNWLAAPASDVYQWAKAETKPGYTATEISRASSNVDTDLKAAEDAIKALQTAIGGSGSVATMIQTAIEALDENTWAAEDGIKFVTAVGETDGKISVTRRELTAADIPALGIDKITGLQDALSTKANASDVKQTTDAISARLDENGDIDVAIKAAKKAGDDAQTYAEGVNTALGEYKTANDARVKAIEDDYTTAEQAGTIAQGKVDTLANGQVKTNTDAIAANSSAISDLAGEGRTTQTVKGNADAIAKLAQDIGNVANVMNFRGVSTGTNPGDGITDPQSGDVIIFGEAEYVYDGSSWVKFGDASDSATAISNLQERVSTIESDLGAEGKVTASIKAAKDQADKGVADAKTANDAIAVINGDTTTEGSIAKAVSDAKVELKSYADTAESDAVAAAKTYTDTEVKKASDAAAAAQTAIDTHAGKQDNPHQVTKAQVGLGNVENKSTATIKSEFTGAVATGNEGFVTGGAVYTAIDAAKTAVNGYTDTEVKKVDDKATANATDITTIKDNYARVKNNQLVYGQGDAEMVIIFDCGGAN